MRCAPAHTRGCGVRGGLITPHSPLVRQSDALLVREKVRADRTSLFGKVGRVTRVAKRRSRTARARSRPVTMRCYRPSSVVSEKHDAVSQARVLCAARAAKPGG